ncbi:MAG: polymer-forming cytoskeletal protein [Bacteroidetes bacterium]|nr:polymer-forming cytoskeletal protein [Bacteroidota bacterium]
MKSDAVKEVNLIGAGTVVEGKIRSQGSIRIDGKVLGDILANEAVAIGLSGEVEGNITAKNVTVGGKVRGTITAAEKVVFEGKSVIRGDVRATRLVVDEGSIFDGKIAMAEKSQQEVRQH